VKSGQTKRNIQDATVKSMVNAEIQAGSGGIELKEFFISHHDIV
jgi:hypothetical protein